MEQMAKHSKLRILSRNNLQSIKHSLLRLFLGNLMKKRKNDVIETRHILMKKFYIFFMFLGYYQYRKIMRLFSYGILAFICRR